MAILMKKMLIREAQKSWENAQKKEEKQTLKRLQITMPPEVYEALKAAAFEQDKSKSAVLVEAFLSTILSTEKEE